MQHIVLQVAGAKALGKKTSENESPEGKQEDLIDTTVLAVHELLLVSLPSRPCLSSSSAVVFLLLFGFVFIFLPSFLPSSLPDFFFFFVVFSCSFTMNGLIFFPLLLLLLLLAIVCQLTHSPTGTRAVWR